MGAPSRKAFATAGPQNFWVTPAGFGDQNGFHVGRGVNLR